MKLIKVQQLKKYYYSGLFKKKINKAVDGISFELEKGKTLGLVGESGSGKSTIGRTILRLIEPSSGTIWFDGKELTSLTKNQLKKLRTEAQIIFQHPESSLNPRFKIIDSIAEPLRLHKQCKKEDELQIVLDMLELVNLRKEILNRYPHEISGGEIQRVVLARILTMNPKFIVADEPTSMLDVSVQAQILNLMKNLQIQLGISYLFISHDLEVVKWMSDEIITLDKGKIVNIEDGEKELQTCCEICIS